METNSEENAGGGLPPQISPADMSMVFAAMMEELGTARKDTLPLDDGGRRGAHVPLPLPPRRSSTRNINSAVAAWRNFQPDDVDPAEAELLNSFCDGQLHRLRREAEAHSQPPANNGFPNRGSHSGRGRGRSVPLARGGRGGGRGGGSFGDTNPSAGPPLSGSSGRGGHIGRGQVHGGRGRDNGATAHPVHTRNTMTVVDGRRSIRGHAHIDAAVARLREAIPERAITAPVSRPPQGPASRPVPRPASKPGGFGGKFKSLANPDDFFKHMGVNSAQPSSSHQNQSTSADLDNIFNASNPNSSSLVATAPTRLDVTRTNGNSLTSANTHTNLPQVVSNARRSSAQNDTETNPDSSTPDSLTLNWENSLTLLQPPQPETLQIRSRGLASSMWAKHPSDSENAHMASVPATVEWLRKSEKVHVQKNSGAILDGEVCLAKYAGDEFFTLKLTINNAVQFEELITDRAFWLRRGGIIEFRTAPSNLSRSEFSTNPLWTIYFSLPWVARLFHIRGNPPHQNSSGHLHSRSEDRDLVEGAAVPISNNSEYQNLFGSTSNLLLLNFDDSPPSSPQRPSFNVSRAVGTEQLLIDFGDECHSVPPAVTTIPARIWDILQVPDEELIETAYKYLDKRSSNTFMDQLCHELAAFNGPSLSMLSDDEVLNSTDVLDAICCMIGDFFSSSHIFRSMPGLLTAAMVQEKGKKLLEFAIRKKNEDEQVYGDLTHSCDLVNPVNTTVSGDYDSTHSISEEGTPSANLPYQFESGHVWQDSDLLHEQQMSVSTEHAESSVKVKGSDQKHLQVMKEINGLKDYSDHSEDGHEPQGVSRTLPMIIYSVVELFRYRENAAAFYPGNLSQDVAHLACWSEPQEPKGNIIGKARSGALIVKGHDNLSEVPTAQRTAPRYQPKSSVSGWQHLSAVEATTMPVSTPVTSPVLTEGTNLSSGGMTSGPDVVGTDATSRAQPPSTKPMFVRNGPTNSEFDRLTKKFGEVGLRDKSPIQTPPSKSPTLASTPARTAFGPKVHPSDIIQSTATQKSGPRATLSSSAITSPASHVTAEMVVGVTTPVSTTIAFPTSRVVAEKAGYVKMPAQTAVAPTEYSQRMSTRVGSSENTKAPTSSTVNFPSPSTEIPAKNESVKPPASLPRNNTGSRVNGAVLSDTLNNRDLQGARGLSASMWSK